jgi:hypothetical protein
MIFLFSLTGLSLSDNCNNVFANALSSRVKPLNEENLCWLVARCEFSNLIAHRDHGGAIRLHEGITGTSHVIDCRFSSCGATTLTYPIHGGWGGAIWAQCATITVSRCVGTLCWADRYGKFLHLGGRVSLHGRYVNLSCLFMCAEASNLGDWAGDPDDGCVMGGAISCEWDVAMITITNFTTCESRFGSVVRIWRNGAMEGRYLVVAESGRATGVDVGLNNPNPWAVISASRFLNNTFIMGSVYSRAASVSLTECTFLTGPKCGSHVDYDGSLGNPGIKIENCHFSGKSDFGSSPYSASGVVLVLVSRTPKHPSRRPRRGPHRHKLRRPHFKSD